uniref:NAD-dependent epimerase/dehydratase family protein n=1 Tax=Salmonella sp. SAL04286 TaxID=3159864 RepID=UPI00397AA69E
VVYHLAAIADPRICATDFPRAYRVNVDGTRRVLEACATGARTIFLSGAMVYGDPIRLPMDETHPTLSRDPYALTKIMGEC